jgi:hypothetical protein
MLEPFDRIRNFGRAVEDLDRQLELRPQVVVPRDAPRVLLTAKSWAYCWRRRQPGDVSPGGATACRQETGACSPNKNV